MTFKEKLHEAATEFDGHVTNGSLESQMELVTELLREIKSELRTAGDFGEFDHFDGDEYGEQVAIRIMKGVANKHGIDF